MPQATSLGDQSILLQFLLFVDERSSSKQAAIVIQNHLKTLVSAFPFRLKVVEVSDQPQLAEHFRLVATPSLVKIWPEPRQVLVGTNIPEQIDYWWSQWQEELQLLEHCENHPLDSVYCPSPPSYSSELIALTDEIFQLKQECSQLQAQLRFKDQILSMLAHDLRSPLTGASLAVETLEILEKKQKKSPDESAEDGLFSPPRKDLKPQLFRQAKHQLQVMERMLRDLLQASKDMESRWIIHPISLNLGDLLRDILVHSEGRFYQKKLHLHQDIPQDLPKVYGDEELIRQVVVNLLDNAFKYTPPGGEIGVTVLHRTTQKIQVSIRDTGPGIPEEKKEHIFEGHVRLQRDEAQEGYGLGLNLCRRVIQAHYGQIWVDSQRGEGSIFHFTLPVAF